MAPQTPQTPYPHVAKITRIFYRKSFCFCVFILFLKGRRFGKVTMFAFTKMYLEHAIQLHGGIENVWICQKTHNLTLQKHNDQQRFFDEYSLENTGKSENSGFGVWGGGNFD